MLIFLWAKICLQWKYSFTKTFEGKLYSTCSCSHIKYCFISRNVSTNSFWISRGSLVPIFIYTTPDDALSRNVYIRNSKNVYKNFYSVNLWRKLVEKFCHTWISSSLCTSDLFSRYMVRFSILFSNVKTQRSLKL